MQLLMSQLLSHAEEVPPTDHSITFSMTMHYPNLNIKEEGCARVPHTSGHHRQLGSIYGGSVCCNCDHLLTLLLCPTDGGNGELGAHIHLKSLSMHPHSTIQSSEWTTNIGKQIFTFTKATATKHPNLIITNSSQLHQLLNPLMLTSNSCEL